MVNQRSRKPGRKAPPRVQELAAGACDEADETLSGEGAASDEADDEDVRDAADATQADDEDLRDVADATQADDADVRDVADATQADDADVRDEADEAEAVAVEVAGSDAADDGASDAEVAGSDTDDVASPDAEGDPLAAMLAEFDAPRPVSPPGVQLSEELPIDPKDDLRAVEGEASLRLVSILESLLFAAAKPLKVQELRKVLAETSQHQIQLALKHLMAATASRGVVLAQVAGGFQFRTHPDNAVWVQKMLQSKPARLSRTQIETLAIVAYRQPITRPEIDDVRGVDSGAVLKTLLERELIQIVGRKEEPGRPLLYGTTVRFLEFFNLRSLRDMPTLRDFRDLSEESKATLRARLGESEAEALGQGVLGLDLSAAVPAQDEAATPEDAELTADAGDATSDVEEVAEDGGDATSDVAEDAGDGGDATSDVEELAEDAGEASDVAELAEDAGEVTSEVEEVAEDATGDGDAAPRDAELADEAVDAEADAEVSAGAREIDDDARDGEAEVVVAEAVATTADAGVDDVAADDDHSGADADPDDER